MKLQLRHQLCDVIFYAISFCFFLVVTSLNLACLLMEIDPPWLMSIGVGWWRIGLGVFGAALNGWLFVVVFKMWASEQIYGIRAEVASLDDHDKYARVSFSKEEKHFEELLSKDLLKELDAEFLGAQLDIRKRKKIPFWMEPDKKLVRLEKRFRKLAKSPPNKFGEDE